MRESPAADETPPSAPEPALDRASRKGHAPGERHAVLCAFGEAQDREALAALLESEGALTLAASSAEVALSLAEEKAPCFALVDLELGGDEGLPLCRRLRQVSGLEDAAVLAIGPRGGEQSAVAALQAGATDFVKRPFDGDELRLRLRLHLQLHEAQLRQRSVQQRLAAVSSAAREAVIMVDPDGVITHWNRAAASIFGYSQGEALGQNLHELLAPERFRAASAAGFLRFRATGEGAAAGKTLELFALKKGGAEFPIEVTLAPIEVNGEWWARGVVRDLSERQRVEHMLRESESRLRLLDSVPVGIALIGRDRRVRWVNRAALAMTQISSLQEIAGRPCDSALCDGAGRCALRDGAALREGAERLLPRNSAAPIPVIVSAHEVELEDERMLLEAFIDLRPRKQLEAELGHARKLEAVGQLAAGIAHEIDTPTQYLGDSLQFLKEAFDGLLRLLPLYRGNVCALEAEGDPDGRAAAIRALEGEIDLSFLVSSTPRSFELCFEGVTRVTGIVRAMKEFAHPDGREKRPADLNQALRSTITISRNEYKYVADLEASFGDLPPVACHVGDLNQVFLNLIVNAAHAIAEAVGDTGRRGKIRISTHLEGAFARVDIADTGTGIPEAVRPRIFEPFFTTKPVGKGSGQGLAIARSIVADKHGGTLTFESAVGQGTTFTIRVPIDGTPAAEAP